jgi:hypothetical protein
MLAVCQRSPAAWAGNKISQPVKDWTSACDKIVQFFHPFAHQSIVFLYFPKQIPVGDWTVDTMTVRKQGYVCGGHNLVLCTNSCGRPLNLHHAPAPWYWPAFVTYLLYRYGDLYSLPLLYLLSIQLITAM